jgi:rhodanese-related sulfurtransferase
MGPSRTSRNRRWLVVLVVVFVLIGLASRLRPETFAPLIEARFPGVEWIDAETLYRSMNAPELAGPIILDVRTEEEFAVSHLRGAVRVEPGQRDFESLAIDRGAIVVVYCSVGYRSAAIVDALRASGVSDVRNLTGGIFAWANEGHPIFKNGEPASTVHTYGQVWGALLQYELRHPRAPRPR